MKKGRWYGQTTWPLQGTLLETFSKIEALELHHFSPNSLSWIDHFQPSYFLGDHRSTQTHTLTNKSSKLTRMFCPSYTKGSQRHYSDRLNHNFLVKAINRASVIFKFVRRSRYHYQEVFNSNANLTHSDFGAYFALLFAALQLNCFRFNVWYYPRLRLNSFRTN